MFQLCTSDEYEALIGWQTGAAPDSLAGAVLFLA
jgi:hypothetical protein